MNLEQLQQKMKELLEEAKGLQKAYNEKSLTDVQRKRAAEVKDEIKQVGAEIDRFKGDEGMFSQLASIMDHVASPRSATNPLVIPEERHGERHLQGAIRKFMASQEYKRIASTGDGTTGTHQLPVAWTRDGLLHLTGQETPEELRTLIYTGATANIVHPQRLPELYRGDSRENNVRGLFSSGTTDSTTVNFVRELATTNNAGGFQEATGAATPAGAQYAESAITFEVASSNVKSVGHMIPVTREMLEDVSLMETYIQNRMIEMLGDTIDGQLITGAGGNNLQGLANISGFSDLDAAYFAANPLMSATEPAENADRLRRARTYLRTVARARASGVLMNPFDLENLVVARDANGNYLFRSVEEIASRAGGVTIAESESVTAGTAWAVDRRFFWVFDKLDTTVEVSDSNREWFEYRILAIAVRARLAFVPIRPAAAAKIALVTA